MWKVKDLLKDNGLIETNVLNIQSLQEEITKLKETNSAMSPESNKLVKSL
jgi:FtsZ-binding cell division protein ZapB